MNDLIFFPIFYIIYSSLVASSTFGPVHRPVAPSNNFLKSLIRFTVIRFALW